MADAMRLADRVHQGQLERELFFGYALRLSEPIQRDSVVAQIRMHDAVDRVMLRRLDLRHGHLGIEQLLQIAHARLGCIA